MPRWRAGAARICRSPGLAAGSRPFAKGWHRRGRWSTPCVPGPGAHSGIPDLGVEGHGVRSRLPARRHPARCRRTGKPDFRPFLDVPFCRLAGACTVTVSATSLNSLIGSTFMERHTSAALTFTTLTCSMYSATVWILPFGARIDASSAEPGWTKVSMPTRPLLEGHACVCSNRIVFQWHRSPGSDELPAVRAAMPVSGYRNSLR